MKKIICALLVMMCTICPVSHAATAGADIQINYKTNTFKQIEVAYYDCWRYSDGVTWQDKEPGDNVDFSFTVTADSSDVTGIKSVHFFTDDEAIYNSTSRQSWQPYDEYMMNIYPDAVNNCSPQGEYIGNAKARIQVNTTLVDWESKDDLGGFEITKIWQHKKVTGRRFYVPVIVEWEMKTAYEAVVQIIITDQYGVERDRKIYEGIPIPSVQTFDAPVIEGAKMVGWRNPKNKEYEKDYYGVYNPDDFEDTIHHATTMEIDFREDGYTTRFK